MKRLKALAPEAYARLEECPETEGGCCKPFCPHCARSFRLWRAAESERLVVEQFGELEKSLVTIIFREIAAGSLSDINLKSELDKLRVDLMRSVGKQLRIIGGIEVAWRKGVWSLHIHAIALGSLGEKKGKLAKRFAKRAKRAVVVQALIDLDQVTYAGKFQDSWKISNGNKRSRVVPLPIDQLVELHKWWGHYRLRDFLFLYGLRISGSRFVPTTAKTTSARALHASQIRKLKRRSKLRASAETND